MYSSSHIQVPDVPGKIVRRKKGNGIYVLYEVARVYDPKRQFNVPKRVIIGKLVSDGERQKFCVHGIIGARQTGASNEHEHQTQFS